LLVATEVEVTAAALIARVAMTAETSNTDALADLPDARRVLADCNDPPYDFVTGNAWRLECRIGAIDITRIGTADPACLDR
jgi:hypothetical protein